MRGVLLAAVVAAAAVLAGQARAEGTFLDPVWSPDGASVAWAEAPLAGVPSPPNWEIWTAAADGSGAQRAAAGPALSEGLDQIDWFAPVELAFFGNFSLFLLPLGGQPTLVTRDIGDAFARDARGDRFAFTTSPCGQGLCPTRVVVYDPATGKRRVLGGPKVKYLDPTLSPDGSRVAFTTGAGLVVARADGTHLHVVAPHASCPQWSPDGRRILYAGPGGWIRAVPAGGGRSVGVIKPGVGCAYAPFRWGWSPDGRTVAVIVPPADRLSLLDVATRKLRTLTGFAHVVGFAFSPDGSQLLVASRPTPAACSSIWRIGVDGSGPQLVTRC